MISSVAKKKEEKLGRLGVGKKGGGRERRGGGAGGGDRHHYVNENGLRRGVTSRI